MYSINGRKKDKKETATVSTKVTKLTCDDCGYIELGKFKEFGEVAVCSQCGSENVEFDKA